MSNYSDDKYTTKVILEELAVPCGNETAEVGKSEPYLRHMIT